MGYLIFKDKLQNTLYVRKWKNNKYETFQNHDRFNAKKCKMIWVLITVLQKSKQIML